MKKIICLFSFLLILCITGCNKEIYIEKAKAKEELYTYIDEIEKPPYSHIKQEFCLINEFIETEMDKFEETISEKDLDKIKKQLSKMVLTKEQAEELTDDSIFILHRPIGYYDYGGWTVCFGIYNDAIVVLKQDYIASIFSSYYYIYDFTFEFPSFANMYVYKNHTFYSFDNTNHAEELINNNILTMDDIESIYKTYQGYYNNRYGK